MEGESKVRQFLRKDITLRIISIFIAFILWLYVVDIQNPQMDMNIRDIPVQFINIQALDDQGLMVMNEKPQTISLRVRGRRKTLASIKSDSIKAFVDLRGLNKTGEHPVFIQTTIPLEGVEIIDKNPYYAEIKLDKIVQIQKEINIVTRGNVQTPYIALEPKIRPNTVVLRGPSAVINAVEQLVIEVDITGHTKDIVFQQSYDIYNRNNEKIINHNLRKDIEMVEIIYPIKKTKRVPIRPIITGESAADYIVTAVNFSPEYVTLAGTEEQLNAIEQVNTVEITIDDIQEGIRLEVPIVLQEGLRVVNGTDIVQVLIGVDREIERTIEIETIRVHNVPEEFSYKMVTKELEIMLRGIESKINLINDRNLNVSVDIGQLEEGEHEVPVNISTSADIEVMESYVAVIQLIRQQDQQEEAIPVYRPDEDDQDQAQQNNGQ